VRLNDDADVDEKVVRVRRGGRSGRDEIMEKAKAKTVKMDNPLWFVLKAICVYALVFLDIFLNSSVNSDNYEGLVDGRLTNFWPFLFLVVQTSVQLFIFLTLFLMMCNTYLMQIGLPGVVLSDFKVLGIAQLVYFVLTIVLGAMRIVRFEETKMTADLDLWSMPGFKIIFVIQNLSAALYYHQVLYSTFRLADEKYYSF